MQVHTFIADSAVDAIAQIRAKLGPDAVVLNVRRPPLEGLARFWQKPRIEVLAHVPDQQGPVMQPDALAELREELREIRQKVDFRQPEFSGPALKYAEGGREQAVSGPGTFPPEDSAPLPASFALSAVTSTAGSWRVGGVLEQSGLLPLHAQSVVEALRIRHGEVPPSSLAEEFALVRSLLIDRWGRPAGAQDGRGKTHIFVGTPGVGKTTCLCKWLAQAVLVEGQAATVWRLDGGVANTAESLSVFCEILGVPLERFAPAGSPAGNGLLFIDLPGVNPADPASMAGLTRQLQQLPKSEVHLVVNAAYETPLLMAQVRAFAALPNTDIIVTHLDEEPRWGKLWNLVLGTNCSLRFLSAGQNIPGEFLAATPDRILARQFARK